MTAARVRARCRACDSSSLRVFLELGETPLADALRTREMLDADEPRYRLDVALCADCALVQLLQDVPAQVLFVDNYHYFSSYADDVGRHALAHVQRLVAERALGPDSLIVELASNDGYLLRHAVAAGVGVLGVDPAPEQAAAAEAAGVPTLVEFFGRDVARRLVGQGRAADVVVANNVMAHVPDLGDFVGGIAALLRPDGVATVENPSVVELIRRRAFDTVYHEHVCYYSCTSVAHLLARHGLHLNHVEAFPELHGGTLRWWAGHQPDPSDAVREHLRREAELGVATFEFYAGLADEVARLQADLLALLRELRAGGASIAAYGAAAKGATLLNTTGVDESLLDFVVDRNPHKQGRWMPGARLEILAPEALLERRPDYVLLLAWNFADEVVAQQSAYVAAGGRFIVPVPEPRVLATQGAR